MIVVELIGGLGNQLFQYAFGKALALKHKTKLKLDITAFESYKLHSYSLNHFNIEQFFASKSEIERFKPTSQQLIDRVFRKIRNKIKPVQVITEPYFHFNEAALLYPNNSYLQGYWQTEKYFKHIDGIIRNDLIITTAADDFNKSFIQKITKVNSISLHVRRGDYVSDPNANKVHGTSDLNYYHKAIGILSSKVENPHFFIFSDDPQWAKENLNLSFPCYFVDHNDSTKNYEDLRLMSTCNHHIIANSSFSWWGAWLNSNTNKMVIGPQNWFIDKSRNDKDIIPANWMKI